MKTHISQYPDTRRLEQWTDGVIAIIVTIMVLELKVPQLIEGFTREEFLVAMHHITPKLIAYGMSFVVVAIFWVNHHNLFILVTKNDGRLLWYNNFLLFWLTLIPFGTAFLGEHPRSVEVIIIYGSMVLMGQIGSLSMTYYVAFKGRLIDEMILEEERHILFMREIPGTMAYLFSVALAPVAWWISWTIFLCVPVWYFMPKQIDNDTSVSPDSDSV